MTSPSPPIRDHISLMGKRSRVFRPRSPTAPSLTFRCRSDDSDHDPALAAVNSDGDVIASLRDLKNRNRRSIRRTGLLLTKHQGPTRPSPSLSLPPSPSLSMPPSPTVVPLSPSYSRAPSPLTLAHPPSPCALSLPPSPQALAFAPSIPPSCTISSRSLPCPTPPRSPISPMAEPLTPESIPLSSAHTTPSPSPFRDTPSTSSSPLPAMSLPPSGVRDILRVQGDVTTDFELGELLGKGAFAQVLQAKDRATGQVVAVKRINKMRLMWYALRRKNMELDIEAKLLQHLQHPHIIGLLRVYDSPRELSLVMEHAAGGELGEILSRQKRPLLPGQARSVMVGVLRALAYMHNSSTVHRDIKPDNVLLMRPGSYDHIKITDFGLSKLSDTMQMSTFVGTPTHLAPEMLMGNSYGREVDLWSAGVMLYQLLSVSLPFHGRSNEELYVAIQTSLPSFEGPWWHSVATECPQALDLVSKLLTPDPAYRMTAEQALTHPFLATPLFPSLPHHMMRLESDSRIVEEYSPETQEPQ